MASIRSIPGWQSMTASELVAFTQSHPETAIPIPAQSLRNWFADNRFAWLGTNNKWVGPLVNAVTDEGTPPAAAAGLERLFTHLLFPGSQVVDTDRDTYAGLLLFVMFTIQPTGDQLAAFYSEAGGRKYPLFASNDDAESAKTAALLADEQATARETIATAISQADAARFTAEQSGASGAACIAAWLAKINEVLG